MTVVTEQSQEEIRASYLEQSAPKRVEQSRIGCVVALIFMPLGSSLDFVLYPEMVRELTMVRLGSVLLVALTYPLHIAAFAQKWIKYINLSYPAILAVAVCIMISMTEGLNGPYYAGLIMLVLAVALLLPLTTFEAVVFVVFTIISYVVFGTYRGLEYVTPSLAYNNLYFLISTGIIAITSSYFSEKARFREYQLTFELDQRNKQLADMDRVKSDFYANISHELRTPLTLILAPVEDLLASLDPNDKTRRQLSYVKENTYRLLKLVNDLLDVLRLEERKDLLEKQPIIVNGVLANIVAGMESLATRKVIDLSFDSPDFDVRVVGDASAIEKIFINLINNALKFTEPGGSIDVRLETTDKLVSVSVVDTGVGIATEDLPYIFDRFHQVDSSATRKHQGTGLGLALVKELTELQGGHVKVRSRVGHGTNMTVELPIASSALSTVSYSVEDRLEEPVDGLETLHKAASYSIAEPQFEQLEIAESRREKTESFVGAKLLIVEDESDVRNYLAEALAPIYDIDVAEDGAEGLYKIQTNKPDLVVLDLMLPKMDGLSVCAAAKKDPLTSQSKIMLLTARTDEQSKMTALKHGADDFLTKPFSTVEIKTRLENLWKNSSLQRDLAARNEDLSSALSDLRETQGQLVQSEKLNALGRLAAGLLHEVNNPLNFAFATFQLLEREPTITDDESLAEMMTDIRVGLERIASIVKDLKTFAYPEKTDLEKVFYIRETVDSAVRLTSKKTINTEMNINIDEKLALKGSQSHIVQILVNLIENAVDAMNASNTENQSIAVFTADHPNDETRIRVHVKDCGPGISPEKIELIFDPFFTTKDVGAGMGMGLSICHTIVKNHGGELKVESEEGSYTNFYFDLVKEISEQNGSSNPTEGDKACAN